MKEFLTFFTLLSPICILNAQNGITTGMLQYKQTIVIDTVLNSTKETIGTLYFDTQKQHSLYVWDKKNPKYKAELIKKDNGTIQMIQPNGSAGTDTIGRRVYKEFNSQILYMRDILEQWFIVTDTVAIKWNIIDETRISHDMTLQKATGDFRGRHYTAWFNPNIPIPDGPWKLKGLPGLIIEANDEKNHITFKLLSMSIPAQFEEIISKPTARDTINFRQYLESKIKATNEAPQILEARMRQQGATFTGTIRTNLIERSL